MKNESVKLSTEQVIDPSDSDWTFDTHSDGPQGKLPYTEELLINQPSGFHFGMSQSAGMGWNPSELLRKHFLILSTSGGIRDQNGEPLALGLHTGHFELVLQVEAAAREF